jgi:hypothetical protein
MQLLHALLPLIACVALLGSTWPAQERLCCKLAFVVTYLTKDHKYILQTSVYSTNEIESCLWNIFIL